MMSLSTFIVNAPSSHAPVEYKQEECPVKKFKDFALIHIEKEAENMKNKDRLLFIGQLEQLLSSMRYQLEGLIQLKNNPIKLQQEYDKLIRYFTETAERFKQGYKTYQHEVQSVMNLIDTTRSTLLNTPTPAFQSFTPPLSKIPDKPPLPSLSDANIEVVRMTSDAPFIFPTEEAIRLHQSRRNFDRRFKNALSLLCRTNLDAQPEHPRLCRIAKACLPDSLRPKIALVLRSQDHLAHSNAHNFAAFKTISFERIYARNRSHKRFFWDEKTFCRAINKVTDFSGPIDLLVIQTHGTWLSFNPESGSSPIYTTNQGRSIPLNCLSRLADRATVVIDSSSSGLGKELLVNNMANHVLHQSPIGTTVYAPTESSYGFILQGDEFKFLSTENPGRDITYKADFSSFCEKRVEWMNLQKDYHKVQTEIDALMRDVEKIQSTVLYGAH